MHEIKDKLTEVSGLIDVGLKNVNLPVKKATLADLNKELEKPDLWNDRERAQEISKKASHLSKLIETWEGMRVEADELTALIPEIHPEKDPKSAEEFTNMVLVLETKWRKLEISTFLSGKYDENNAILTIHAGTGGTDAQDFAEILLRMYLRYSERQEFQTQIFEKSEGEEAGIKSCTVMIKGQFAYGYLKGESGVHRLVRLSPFNSGSTRETSFVLVEVLPEIDKSDEVLIDSDDLRIDTYRAGGHGGQNVNKTDSAVRITHLPTGIVVTCQNERSQLQNKEQAMKVLHSRLVDLMEKQHAKEIGELRAEKREVTWGSQIRSYVIHPYKMVKDHRSGYEEHNPEAVFNGELDGFIEAELKKMRE
ncbi:MAG: peptide chain release factor 2 [Candidatus Gracilibacteria bacterium]